MKRCSKCGEVKGLECFPREKRALDGRASACRACKSARERAYRRANQEKVRERGRAKFRAYREANPEKVAARWRAWREANREKVAAWERAWREANREKVAARERVWRKANPEKVSSSKRARRARKLGHAIKSEGPTWQAIGPRDGWRCHICGKLIPKKYRDGAPYDHGDRMAPTVDHLVPLADGGSDTFANVRLAHKSCNSAKGAKRQTVQLLLVGKP